MTEKQSELRRDAHHGGWVLLPHQSEREQLLNTPRHEWLGDALDAVSNPAEHGAHVIWQKSIALAKNKTHTVRVVPNAFALYRVEGNQDRAGIGMYDQMRGVGAHEIIIESENLDDTIRSLSPHQYALTLEAVQARILDLRNDHRLHSFTWLREWVPGGHTKKTPPHSQLVASAIIPLGLKNELDAAREYYRYKERCLFCDMIRQEQSDQSRLVFETQDYITYCPFASRHPFEVHLFPKQHEKDFTREPAERLVDLASVLRDTAHRLLHAVPGWRVLMVLHSAPVFDPLSEYFHSIGLDFHWHIEFLPMPPGYVDWYERTGTHVECTPPERAAEFLRSVEVPSPWG